MVHSAYIHPEAQAELKMVAIVAQREPKALAAGFVRENPAMRSPRLAPTAHDTPKSAFFNNARSCRPGMGTVDLIVLATPNISRRALAPGFLGVHVSQNRGLAPSG